MQKHEFQLRDFHETTMGSVDFFRYLLTGQRWRCGSWGNPAWKDGKHLTILQQLGRRAIPNNHYFCV